MITVKDIIKKLDSPSEKDIAIITKSYSVAEKAHEGQKRKSGEPYMVHAAAIGLLLAEMGVGSRTIAAGILHDTIEDTDTTTEYVKEQFGDEILFLVEGVTKLSSIRYHGADRHNESLRKLFVATSQDIRVLIIKLVDRLHNMRTLEFVSKEKQLRIARETLEIYVPIAHRLGMGSIRKDLEDLAFPYVYPKESENINKLLKERSSDSRKYLQKILKILKKTLGKENFTDFRSEERIKGHYSLHRKLERKNFDMSKIHDILALRIIVPTISDCYRVLGVVHGIWRPLPGKIKDYIAFPKPNGYQSIHTTVLTGPEGTIEIQIRTEQMHHEAQFGIASHMSYKARKHGEKNIGIDWILQFLPSIRTKTKEDLPKLKQKESKNNIPKWIKQIAEKNIETSELEDEEYLKEIKKDFFSHRVFSFTPKGDVIDLPIDSSPIDFAYAIHSDIGNHVFGAMVNGKMVSLDTKLGNGDIVEILTKEKSKPTRKWLEFVRTTLAKRHIRTAITK